MMATPYELMEHQHMRMEALKAALFQSRAETDRLAAEVERLREALLALKNGDCWCDRYYDPMCGHQDRCNQAAVAAKEKI